MTRLAGVENLNHGDAEGHKVNRGLPRLKPAASYYPPRTCRTSSGTDA
jgi:hypothetical protein